MAGDLAARLGRQYNKCLREDHENILFFPNEADMSVWHCVVVGLGFPYLGAEIIFEVKMPPEFPRKPPSVRCFTENGVYVVGPRICISIGEYHAGDRHSSDGGAWGWRSTMGVIRFVQEMMNGLINPGSLNLHKHPDSGRGGIGIEDKSVAERVMLSLNSYEFNTAPGTDLAALRQKFWEKVNTKGVKAFTVKNKDGTSKDIDFFDLRAAQAWRRQIAQRNIVHPVVVGGTKDFTSPERFCEAFGPELWKWVTELGGNRYEIALRIDTVKQLRKWDSLDLRRCCLLREICKAGSEDILSPKNWEVLKTAMPVGKFPSPLKSWSDLWGALRTLQGGGRDIDQLIEIWMGHIMEGNLDARDEHFVCIVAGRC